VNSGALYLAAAAIDRIVNGMSEAAGGTTGVVMTGGDAERVLPLLAVSVHHEPDLVLQGLAILSAGGN
jgi:type III pantothenate kinase